MNTRFFTAGLATLCLAASLPAEQPTSQPATSQPSELEKLRAENAQLRQELAVVKAQAATVQSQPAAKKETPKSFTTMMDVLSKTPEDLRPQAKPEWHKYTEPKFIKWAEEQFVGMTYEATLKVNPSPAQPNVIHFAKGAEWIGRAGFDDQHFTYFGADHTYSPRFPDQYFDDVGAKKWDTIKKGTLFKIKGVISDVSVRRVDYDYNKLPKYHVTFTLRDIELIPPK